MKGFGLFLSAPVAPGFARSGKRGAQALELQAIARLHHMEIAITARDPGTTLVLSYGG